MIICDDKYPKILDEILKFLSNDDVELVFVDCDEMRRINKENRNIDKTTDVLSFPLEFVYGSVLGSIVINLDLVSKKANELNHTNDDEIALLFTHGLLHILGFDHEIDSGEMRQQEARIIEHFNLPPSLIVRTQG
ncbi:rRNA maturation RNase YbeY [Campylobacter sp. RM12327]|uniref:rRNA maturation RNase YbeY n=1 Tax=Campylobacter sputorum TaxID=206 RepID=UPI00053C064B|nr:MULTISPECIES: rRNA maturation RNase YbeY [Campylobacter]ASM39645.1 metal-dependent hydrolase (UPF0054 domain) [Campylobacter sputorum]MBE7358347.1 rRNA maturation RNase YbeY [Campylobacter sp. RM11302]MBF6669509.1 rRNA maturation RNase YbeY [Campylobacter sp. RM12327]MBF6674748.1 rRNA maturation RNase YbeY [Campylobacter sp. RM13538]MBF6676383.1 rRNA maturation RNase YbeY [Campylobacter sp. RM12321]